MFLSRHEGKHGQQVQVLVRNRRRPFVWSRVFVQIMEGSVLTRPNESVDRAEQLNGLAELHQPVPIP